MLEDEHKSGGVRQFYAVRIPPRRPTGAGVAGATFGACVTCGYFLESIFSSLQSERAAKLDEREGHPEVRQLIPFEGQKRLKC